MSKTRYNTEDIWKNNVEKIVRIMAIVRDDDILT